MLRRVFGCVITLLLLGPLHATTVVDFGIEDLARLAHVGVRARVLAVDSSDPRSARCEFEVEDILFGEAPSRLSLDLDTLISGMPDLRPGDEVVLFVNFTNQVEKIIGLRWGTYRVQNNEIYSHEWLPLELTTEMPATSGPAMRAPAGFAAPVEERRPRKFLRQRMAPVSGSLSYSEMKTAVSSTRERLIADGIPVVTAESSGN